MTEPTTRPIKIDGYHAHVYYTAETRARRTAAGNDRDGVILDVEVRELSDAPKGPRSRSSGSRSPLRSSRMSCRG
jgi:aromatic ring-cleaving dioxygenase